MNDPRLAYIEALGSLSKFIGSMVHDLSNPLASVMGYTHLLGTETNPKRIQQYAAQIQAQAVRCRKLMERVQQCVSQPTPDNAAVPLAGLLGGSIAVRTSQIDESKVRVAWRVEQEGLAAHGDLELLLRALGQLLDNAILAANGQGDGEVELVARRVNDRVRVEVHDTGPGIPPELRDRVFDPTFTTRRTSSGVGVGLTTTLRIALAHSGDVLIEDSPLGGACVALDLPPATLGQLEPPASMVEEAPEPNTIGPKQTRVLCVDDEPYILEIYAEIMGLLNLDFELATTIQDALQIVKTKRLDWIISDLNLSDGMATNLLNHVRETHPDLAERFVICTGNPHCSTLAKVHQAEIRVLAKPFTMMDLKSLLHEVP